MKAIKIIASIFFILTAVITMYFSVTYSDPPKEWWGPEVTISQIEKEYIDKLESTIKNYKDEGYYTYNRKTGDLRPATKEEVNERIKELKEHKEFNTPQWLQLKDLYKKGDAVSKYSEPVYEHGEDGYILVRDNNVIFKYEMWAWLPPYVVNR